MILKLWKEHIWGIIAIVAGSSLRLLLYYWNDSLFRDESKVLLNIINKSFTGLAGKLDYDQTATLPFLWALRSIHVAIGDSEFYFRLIPLIAGLCALTLYYFLACKTLNSRYGIIASTWLFAVAFNVILYSTITKQYSLDILIATILIYAFYPVVTKPLQHRSILFLTTISVTAIFISFPAIFILGGIIVGLFVNFRKTDKRFTILFTGIIFLSFIILYTFVMKKQVQPNIFEHSFAPHTFDLWYLNAILVPVDGILGRIRYLQYLLLFICAIGLFNYARRGDNAWAFTLISPVILALMASWLHKYPFLPRLLLYTTPGLLLLFGHGVGSLCDSARGRFKFGLLITLIIVPYTIVAIVSFSKPCGGVREAIQYVGNNKRADDIILVDLFAASTVQFYQYSGLGSELISNNNLTYEWTVESTIHNAPSAKALISSMPGNKHIWLVSEASGGPRRIKTGFLRERTNEIERLLHVERDYIDKYYTDRAFAVCYSPQKKR